MSAEVKRSAPATEWVPAVRGLLLKLVRPPLRSNTPACTSMVPVLVNDPSICVVKLPERVNKPPLANDMIPRPQGPVQDVAAVVMKLLPVLLVQATPPTV